MKTRHASKAQESKLAQDLGIKCSANSGAALWAAGDVYGKNILLECKTKMEPSKNITIQKAWLNKIKEEAIMNGKEMYGLAFNFEPGGQNWIAIPQWMLEEYIELKENQ